MAADKEMLTALDKIEKALERKEKALARAPNLTDLCKQYQKVKPLLTTILPFIEKIPVYGGKIANAIRFLMAIAEVACPT